MILILSVMEDITAAGIMDKLRDRGADVLGFNPRDFPQHTDLLMAFSENGEMRRSLRVAGREIDLETVRSAWYWRPEAPRAAAAIVDDALRASADDDCRRLIEDLWHTLDCLWVPGPRAALLRADNKALQLKLAGELGFDLPPTLITNSPDAFLDFYRRHEGRLVSKKVAQGPAAEWSKDVTRYTEPVSPRDVGYADTLQLCPVIFQAYVAKRVELRITVVGQSVFAAEIDSQGTNRTRFDWRHYDADHTEYRVHDLPEGISTLCKRLVTELGLVYGAIDMIVTPDGRYVFLEINPNGQHGWIEHLTGLPISDALCDLLIEGRPIAPDVAKPMAESAL